MTAESTRKGQPKQPDRRSGFQPVEVPPGSKGTSITDLRNQTPNFQPKGTPVIGQKTE